MKHDFEIIAKIVEEKYLEIETFDEVVAYLNSIGIAITDEELFAEAYKYPIIDSYLVSF